MTGPVACFGATCPCGYGELYPAPTVADILPAAAAMAEAGWTYDAEGLPRCPECSRSPRPAPPPSSPGQGDLFS